MKYEILILCKNKNKKGNTLYSNYAKSNKELKDKINYFMKEKKFKLNNDDMYNNIQVSKKIGKHWLILSAEEILDIIK